MVFVPEGQPDSSQARSAWNHEENSPPPMMFDRILEFMNGFSAKIGSIVPLGRGYFPYHPKHSVPGYYRAVLRDKKKEFGY
jgi:hypothetical protein